VIVSIHRTQLLLSRKKTKCDFLWPPYVQASNIMSFSFQKERTRSAKSLQTVKFYIKSASCCCMLSFIILLSRQWRSVFNENCVLRRTKFNYDTHMPTVDVWFTLSPQRWNLLMLLARKVHVVYQLSIINCCIIPLTILSINRLCQEGNHVW